MNGPVEPHADMRLMANTTRQMFVALLAEGFTEAQALAIVAAIIAATTK